MHAQLARQKSSKDGVRDTWDYSYDALPWAAV